MARGRRDVFGGRTTSMVARILAWLGIEPERWAMRQAYGLALTRRLAVSRARRATWCCLETAQRRSDIYTGGAGEPPVSCMQGNRRNA